MFGAIPKRAWRRKISPDEDNRCLLSMNCLLIRSGERILLVDTGVGSKDLKKLSYYDFRDLHDIRDLLRQSGISPEEVSDVILSHLHFDHCGGCTYLDEKGNLQVSFPNARHYVGKRQWENYLNPNDLERDSFRPEDMLPIQEKGLLHLVDKDTELWPGIHLQLCDGHTYDQLVVSALLKDELLIYPGDAIPTRAHLSDEWISAYDIEPLQSLASKRKIKQLAEGKKHQYVFYHSL